MRNPFRKKTELELRKETADKKLAELHLRKEVEDREAKLLKLEEEDKYRTGSPSVKATIELRREAERGKFLENRRKRQEQLVVSSLNRVGQGFSLLTAAKQCEEPNITAGVLKFRIGESMLEEFSYLPFDYGFISGIIGKLYQVQGLIRELYPYKTTIIRYIQQLDFARWACRVLYEECPAAKGLIKGKTNFVIRRGLTCKIVSKDKAAGETEACKKAQYFVDKFHEENDFCQKEMERYRRTMIDGEAFMWIADPSEPERSCEVAFIEPDFIRPSQKGLQSQEDPHMAGGEGEDWSFGIHTPKHRYYKPLGYQVVWNDNEEQKIAARYMVHSAVRERSNIKRCLPPLLSASDDLIRLTVLRAALAESVKFRASIGGVIKYEEASQQAICSEDEIYGRSLGCGSGDEYSYHTREWEHTGHSNIVELAPGRGWVNPPPPSTEDELNTIYDWHNNAIAQQFQVPSWLISGSAEGGSYADSLTAESPSVVEFESEQAVERKHTKKAIAIELQYRIDKQELPADFFEKYDIDVQSDSVITRDSKSEMETHVMAVGNQLESLSTARAQLGLDPEREATLIEAECKLGLGPVWNKEAREGRNEQSEEEGARTTQGAKEIEASPKTVAGQQQREEGGSREQ